MRLSLGDWRLHLLSLVSLYCLLWSIHAALMPQDYVSDEIWYVPAARNLLNEWGLKPSPAFITAHQYCAPGAQPLRVAQDGYAWYPPGTHVLDGIELGGRRLKCYVRYGWFYPDHPEIVKYMNWEHPWLGKYLLMALMLTVGDFPTSWRLMPFTFGLLTLVLLYDLTRRIFGVEKAVAAGMMLLADASFRQFSAMAMLDEGAAFGAMLITYAYLRWSDKPLICGALAGIATSVKYTVLPTAVTVYLLTATRKYSDGLKYVGAALTCFLLAHAPVICWLGWSSWVDEVKGGVLWFTSPRPEGPIASNPLDWLVGLRSFVHLQSPNYSVVAMGNPYVYLLAVAVAAARIGEGLNKLLLGSWAMWLLVMALGNTTLYSYYSLAFAPLVPLALVNWADSREKYVVIAVVQAASLYAQLKTLYHVV